MRRAGEEPSSTPEASRATYRQWVVDALTALGPSGPKAVYDWIRRHVAVPAADLSGRTPDGENLFEKTVRFARLDLFRDGVVTSPRRGVWSLPSHDTRPSATKGRPA